MAWKTTPGEAQGAPVADDAPPAGREREDFAGHLARVTSDADRNKALLQARYKALHDAYPEHPGTD